MNLIKQFSKGTQIAYIPNDVDRDNLDHPDVEFGFIEKLMIDRHCAMCRFWSRSNPNRLGTVANSELTPLENIVAHQIHDQQEITRLLGLIATGELTMGNCFIEEEKEQVATEN